MILGCVAVGFTAQASAADLVDLIAAGGDVNWTGGDVTLTETLKITGSKTIDLNGAVITGPEGKAAVEIKGDVTLYDGVIVANNKAFSGEVEFVKSLLNYKPAVSIKGGTVVLDCITAVGSLIRIPNSSSVEVPVGNGINADAGNITLKNTIAIGMNALDNDNTQAKVTVEDAILVGIYKAVNRSSSVNFGGDSYTQYKTVDFLEAFLKDGVKLSANEKKYIDSATNSEGDLSVASVLVNVKNPSFNELTSVYNNGVLSVIAQADLHEEDGVSNRYSYKYTPDTCTVDGKEADFELVDGQYVAQFEGLAENQVFEAEANYDLSVKLGKKQKEVVDGALDMIASYAAKAPALLNRFIKDFESLYEKVRNIETLAYNAISEAKDDSLNPVKGLIYALEGREYSGMVYDQTVGKDVLEDKALVNLYTQKAIVIPELYTDSNSISTAFKAYANDKDIEAFNDKVFARTTAINDQAAYYNGKIFDTNGDGTADSLFAYTYDNTFDLTGITEYKDTPFATGTPGYGTGKGLLDVFDEYYKNIKSLLYTCDKDGNILDDSDFNDIGAAAAYVGENWKGILELVENAVVVLDKANALLEDADEDSALYKLLEELPSSITSYLGYVDTAVGYAHKVMDKVDEVKASNFVKTYLADSEKAAKYCKTYALKAWDIASNPGKYFTVETDGDYVNVNLTNDVLNTIGTVNTNVEAKDVWVKITIVGMGSVSVNGSEAVNGAPVWFAYGDPITVTGEGLEGCELRYMTVDTNGNRNVVTDGTFTAKAATNLDIYVVFENTATSDATEVVFMTDKALNYKYLGGVEMGGENTLAELADQQGIEAPVFKGLRFDGWSTSKDGTGAVAKDLAEVVVDTTKEIVVLYACYTYDEKVEVDKQDKTIIMKSTSSKDGIAYFEVSIQLPANSGAIEAGVIATRKESLGTNEKLLTSLSGTAGVAFGRTSKVDANGYVNQNVLYTLGYKTAPGNTVYGRGYIVYENGKVEYTDVFDIVVE